MRRARVSCAQQGPGCHALSATSNKRRHAWPQVEAQAPELALPAKTMTAPYMPPVLPEEAQAVAAQVKQGLAELPQSFAPVTLQYLMQWASKVRGFCPTSCCQPA